MITVGSCILQFAAKIGFHRFVRVSRSSGAEFNAAVLQGCLGAAADTAADQDVDMVFLQQSRQGAMADTVGIEKGLLNDLSIFRIIDRERLRPSEMLENITVIIGYCNSHLL